MGRRDAALWIVSPSMIRLRAASCGTSCCRTNYHINNRARMTIRLRYAKAAGSFMRAQANAALTERDALAGRK